MQNLFVRLMIESIVFCKEIFIPKFVVEVSKELLIESLDLSLELKHKDFRNILSKVDLQTFLHKFWHKTPSSDTSKHNTRVIIK